LVAANEEFLANETVLHEAVQTLKEELQILTDAQVNAHVPDDHTKCYVREMQLITKQAELTAALSLLSQESQTTSRGGGMTVAQPAVRVSPEQSDSSIVDGMAHGETPRRLIRQYAQHPEATPGVSPIRKPRVSLSPLHRASSPGSPTTSPTNEELAATPKGEDSDWSAMDFTGVSMLDDDGEGTIDEDNQTNYVLNELMRKGNGASLDPTGGGSSTGRTGDSDVSNGKQTVDEDDKTDEVFNALVRGDQQPSPDPVAPSPRTPATTARRTGSNGDSTRRVKGDKPSLVSKTPSRTVAQRKAKTIPRSMSVGGTSRREPRTKPSPSDLVLSTGERVSLFPGTDNDIKKYIANNTNNKTALDLLRHGIVDHFAGLRISDGGGVIFPAANMPLPNIDITEKGTNKYKSALIALSSTTTQLLSDMCIAKLGAKANSDVITAYKSLVDTISAGQKVKRRDAERRIDGFSLALLAVQQLFPVYATLCGVIRMKTAKCDSPLFRTYYDYGQKIRKHQAFVEFKKTFDGWKRWNRLDKQGQNKALLAKKLYDIIDTPENDAFIPIVLCLFVMYHKCKENHDDVLRTIHVYDKAPKGVLALGMVDISGDTHNAITPTDISDVSDDMLKTHAFVKVLRRHVKHCIADVTGSFALSIAQASDTLFWGIERHDLLYGDIMKRVRVTDDKTVIDIAKRVTAAIERANGDLTADDLEGIKVSAKGTVQDDDLANVSGSQTALPAFLLMQKIVAEYKKHSFNAMANFLADVHLVTYKRDIASTETLYTFDAFIRMYFITRENIDGNVTISAMSPGILTLEPLAARVQSKTYRAIVGAIGGNVEFFDTAANRTVFCSLLAGYYAHKETTVTDNQYKLFLPSPDALDTLTRETLVARLTAFLQRTGVPLDPDRTLMETLHARMFDNDGTYLVPSEDETSQIIEYNDDIISSASRNSTGKQDGASFEQTSSPVFYSIIPESSFGSPTRHDDDNPIVLGSPPDIFNFLNSPPVEGNGVVDNISMSAEPPSIMLDEEWVGPIKDAWRDAMQLVDTLRDTVAVSNDNPWLDVADSFRTWIVNLRPDFQDKPQRQFVDAFMDAVRDARGNDDAYSTVLATTYQTATEDAVEFEMNDNNKTFFLAYFMSAYQAAKLLTAVAKQHGFRAPTYGACRTTYDLFTSAVPAITTKNAVVLGQYNYIVNMFGDIDTRYVEQLERNNTPLNDVTGVTALFPFVGLRDEYDNVLSNNVDEHRTRVSIELYTSWVGACADVRAALCDVGVILDGMKRIQTIADFIARNPTGPAATSGHQSDATIDLGEEIALSYKDIIDNSHGIVFRYCVQHMCCADGRTDHDVITQWVTSDIALSVSMHVAKRVDETETVIELPVWSIHDAEQHFLNVLCARYEENGTWTAREFNGGTTMRIVLLNYKAIADCVEMFAEYAQQALQKHVFRLVWDNKRIGNANPPNDGAVLTLSDKLRSLHPGKKIRRNDAIELFVGYLSANPFPDWIPEYWKHYTTLINHFDIPNTNDTEVPLVSLMPVPVLSPSPARVLLASINHKALLAIIMDVLTSNEQDVSFTGVAIDVRAEPASAQRGINDTVTLAMPALTEWVTIVKSSAMLVFGATPFQAFFNIWDAVAMKAAYPAPHRVAIAVMQAISEDGDAAHDELVVRATRFTKNALSSANVDDISTIISTIAEGAEMFRALHFHVVAMADKLQRRPVTGRITQKRVASLVKMFVSMFSTFWGSSTPTAKSSFFLGTWIASELGDVSLDTPFEISKQEAGTLAGHVTEIAGLLPRIPLDRGRHILLVRMYRQYIDMVTGFMAANKMDKRLAAHGLIVRLLLGTLLDAQYTLPNMTTTLVRWKNDVLLSASSVFKRSIEVYPFVTAYNADGNGLFKYFTWPVWAAALQYGTGPAAFALGVKGVSKMAKSDNLSNTTSRLLNAIVADELTVISGMPAIQSHGSRTYMHALELVIRTMAMRATLDKTSPRVVLNKVELFSAGQQLSHPLTDDVLSLTVWKAINPKVLPMWGGDILSRKANLENDSEALGVAAVKEMKHILESDELLSELWSLLPITPRDADVDAVLLDNGFIRDLRRHYEIFGEEATRLRAWLIEHGADPVWNCNALDPNTLATLAADEQRKRPWSLAETADSLSMAVYEFVTRSTSAYDLEGTALARDPILYDTMNEAKVLWDTTAAFANDHAAYLLPRGPTLEDVRSVLAGNMLVDMLNKRREKYLDTQWIERLKTVNVALSAGGRTPQNVDQRNSVNNAEAEGSGPSSSSAYRCDNVARPRASGPKSIMRDTPKPGAGKTLTFNEERNSFVSIPKEGKSVYPVVAARRTRGLTFVPKTYSHW